MNGWRQNRYSLLDADSGKGHASKVVLKLLRDHLNMRHVVFMDNFYNSVDLAKELLEHCTRTLQLNLERTTVEVEKVKLRKGETILRCCNVFHISNKS